MKFRNYFILIFLVSLAIRIFLNFSQELIPGVNGGYYPLQVRYIISNGRMGFSDMPLLFYLDALLIKLISYFGFSLTDTLILNVVKIVDCISIPFLLFPLLKLLRLQNKTSSVIFKTSIISFAVLSFSPLILTSDLQKNALSITFLFCFIAYLMSYLNNKKKSEIILSTIFLIIIGLTHFATFIFAMLFLILVIGYIYKKKAIIPLSIVIIIGLIIISIFDISRSYRLISFGSLIFEKPALLNGMLAPPDYLSIIISYILAIIAVFVIRTKNNIILLHQKAILFSCIFCLITLSFPLLDGEYFKRLSLFLFIPQLLIMIQIAPIISTKHVNIISVSLLIFTLLSIIAVFGKMKEPVIDKIAYEDLKKINSVIKNDNETIIIARHGLEWWTAWALKTKVGQDKAIDKVFFEKYKNVILINQIHGFDNVNQISPFHEPNIPYNSKIIYSSKYFKAFRFNLK